jgi:hypothetical protein
MACNIEAFEEPNRPSFLAERIRLSSINMNALGAVNAEIGKMPHSSFEDVPNWEAMLRTSDTRWLYILTAFNFGAVDGAIL